MHIFELVVEYLVSIKDFLGFQIQSLSYNLKILGLQKGLKNVFDEAILAALEPPEPVKRRKCLLL